MPSEAAACVRAPSTLAWRRYSARSSRASFSLGQQASACILESRPHEKARQEGWVCLRAAYDDGGFSGATMDRPALQRLLADLTAGRVDTIVVYKIDRLTRAG